MQHKSHRRRLEEIKARIVEIFQLSSDGYMAQEELADELSSLVPEEGHLEKVIPEIDAVFDGHSRMNHTLSHMIEMLGECTRLEATWNMCPRHAAAAERLLRINEQDIIAAAGAVEAVWEEVVQREM
jgi:hypothetical protein